MNLSSYLARTAMANTEALGRTEIAKQRMQTELAQKQEEAQGQAIGGLAGAVLGAGVGAYQKYNAGQESADALRGFQARKDYGTLTDNSLPVDTRVNNVYGPGVAGAVAEETSAMPKGTSMLKPEAQARERSFQDAAAEAVGLTPRIGYTDNLFTGRQVREVPNDPVRDWQKLTTDDAEHFIDASGVNFGRFIRSRR